MRAMFGTLILLLFLPRLCSQPPSGPANGTDKTAIEAAVLEVNNQMTRAAEDVDADRLFSFILNTDKGCIIQNGAIQLTREQALTQTRDGFRTLRKLKYHWKQRYVTVVSPTVAVLTGDGEATATTMQDQTVVTPFAQTQVFVLTRGTWKLMHAHHSTSAPR